MKKNKVLKVLAGILMCSSLFFACTPEPPEEGIAEVTPEAKDSAIEEAFDKALEGVKKTPATEEEFTQLVNEIVAELSQSSTQSNARLVSPSGNSISSKEDISKKLKDLFNKIMDIGKDFNENSKNGKISINFDDSINISDAKLSDLMAALVDVGIFTEETPSLTEYDEIIKIKNAYTKAKVGISIDQEKAGKPENDSESIGSAEIEAFLSGAVTDIEKLLNIKGCPIKVASGVFSLDGNASATYKDLKEIEYATSVPAQDCNEIGYATSESKAVNLENAKLNLNIEELINLAVCTKSGNGGKLSFSVNANLDKSKLVKYFNDTAKMVNETINNPSELAERNQTLMMNFLDTVLSYKISIGEFEKEYTYSEIIKIFTFEL